MTIRSIAAILFAAVAGCANDLPPRSFLDGPRVLALAASPLEAGPGDTVTVRAFNAPQDLTPVSERWTFCPFTLGAAAGDVCAVPQCETPLLPAGGAVVEDPGKRALECLQQFAATGAGVPSGLPSEVPSRLEVLFRYELEAPAGTTTTTVLRVPFYIGGVPADRNAPPVVERVEIGGQPVGGGATPPPLAKGGQLEVKVVLDPVSAQRYQDASGRTVEEALFTSFYTTAGRFDYDRGIGLEPSVKLKDEKIPAGTTSADIWAVVRDDRGGVVVLGPYEVGVVR